MSAADVPIADLSDIEHRAQLRRALIASTVGTTIEWYDFLLYGTVSALVFGPIFFPKSDPLMGVLQSFGIFFIGFVGRPIGAAIFGHWGDRIGRKATLIATLLITGIATIAVGLVPTYVQHRHMGRRAADAHPPDPGYRGRRRMGRLGAARDGVGANQQESRLYRVLAAVRRAVRAVPGELRGAGVQLYVRRSVQRLGLAHPVPDQHRHGRRSACGSGSAFPRRRCSGRSLPKERIERVPVLEVLKRQPKQVILSALLRLPEQGPGYIVGAFIFTYATTVLGRRAISC